MDIDHEEKLLLVEVQSLAVETMANWGTVLCDDRKENKDRRLMAFALLAACRDLEKFLPDDEENWLERFGETLEATIDAEHERYQDACFDDNRSERIIALANLRILRRLRRRVTDPRRRQSLLSEIYTEPLYPAGENRSPSCDS